MIECAACGTDAIVLDRSGGRDLEEELVVLCAECTAGEITGALEPTLLEPPRRNAHARAA